MDSRIWVCVLPLDDKKNMEKNIFISYSHKDKEYLDSFRTHFNTLKDKWVLWDDSRIRIGQNWKKEIDKALNSSVAYILFISSNFMNSKFIMDEELPYILKMSKEQQAKMFIIFVKPVFLKNFPELIEIQGVNSPNHTVIDMDESEKERLWVKLIQEIDSL